MSIEQILPLNQVVQGDSLKVLRGWPDSCIDWSFSSPPYYQLRNYDVDGQIGRESSLHEYLNNLWAIYDEVWRVLKPTGCVWVNLGDSFAGSGGAGGDYEDGGLKENQPKYRQPKQLGIRVKSRMKVPERFSIGMVDRGWIERAGILWYKPNGMIESSKDRPKLDYEFLYMYVKEPRYWFNYVEAKRPLKSVTVKRNQYAVGEMGRLDGTNSAKHGSGKKKFGPPIGGVRAVGNNGNSGYSGNEWEVPHDGMAKIGSVWGLPPQSIWSIAPKTFGHEYCETDDQLVRSQELLFKCIDDPKKNVKGCGTVYKKLDPAQILIANNLDPESKCLVCGRSLKRHLTLNGKGRIEGLQSEVIDCGYFDLPELQIEGCPNCKNKKREFVCPKCNNKIHMHFAMYPEELVMPALRMSCPDQVCSKCGVPRFPNYTPTEEYAKLLGKGWHEHGDDEAAGQMQEKVLPPSIADYRISSWSDCGCGIPFQTAVCLDPFAGFNTTGAVAMKHGRNFVGIELDIRNVKAGNRRIVELRTLKRKSSRAPSASLHLQARLT